MSYGALPRVESGDLDRFLHAQEPVMGRVTNDLAEGVKRGHWMWFVFPQILGLGASEIALRYALASADEARAYYEHPVLGPRLVDCTRAALVWAAQPVGDLFPYPDDLKFRSSMTLFAHVAPEEPVFSEALDAFFGGQPDRRTLELIARAETGE